MVFHFQGIVRNLSIYNTHIDKKIWNFYWYSKRVHPPFFFTFLFKCQMLSWWPIYKYKLINLFWIENKNNFADNYIFFCLVRRVLQIFWPWIMDSFSILFEYEQRVEDRFITFLKDMEIYHKKIGSNWAWEPNESKDSSLVREGIMKVLKGIER